MAADSTSAFNRILLRLSGHSMSSPRAVIGYELAEPKMHAMTLALVSLAHHHRVGAAIVLRHGAKKPIFAPNEFTERRTLRSDKTNTAVIHLLPAG